MRMHPKWHRRELSPAAVLGSWTSTSVVLSSMSLQRRHPLKSNSGLHPGGRLLSSILRLKLLCEAQASISVLSTLTCSSPISLAERRCACPRSTNRRAKSSLNRLGRLALRVEWCQTLSSRCRPTHQRCRGLLSMASTKGWMNIALGNLYLPAPLPRLLTRPRLSSPGTVRIFRRWTMF